MRPVTVEEWRNRVTYIAPDAERKIHHAAVGQELMRAGEVLIDICPNPSRGLSLALTALEEARMWANQAIATTRDDG